MATTERSDELEESAVSAFFTLETILTEDGWQPKWEEDEPFLFVSTFTGRHAGTTVLARIVDGQQWFRVVVIAPFAAPPHLRVAVAEFLSRANYGLNFGAFEMDHADGTLAFRHCISFAESELTATRIREVLYGSTGVTDAYLPGLMAVIYGGMTPEEAIRTVEETEETEMLASDELPN